MTANPIVRKLSFTGSTEIGKQLMAQCAGTVKKVSLELGGATRPSSCSTMRIWTLRSKAPLPSKYRNTGQTCVCANRLLVQDGVYDAFAEKLTKAVAEPEGRQRRRGRRDPRAADRHEGR